VSQRHPTIEFEGVPLDEDRRMSLGPRMNPDRYRALNQKIQLLDNTATRISLPEDTISTTMKDRVLRVGAELGILVTIRRALRDMLFWRSTHEHIH
jgi:hypothetical protein